MIETFNERFGRLLKEARTFTKHGIEMSVGLRPMAKAVKVSPATLSRIERGCEPDMVTARKLGPIVGICPCCGESWPKP